MKPPASRQHLARVVRERQVPGFVPIREDTTIAMATEAKVADDGILLEGPWNLERYQSNPVVLWCHNRSDSGRMPIGRALQVVETEPGTVLAEIEWDAGDPIGAECQRRYAAGFLSAVSIRWSSETIIHASRLPDGDPRRTEDYWVGQGNTLLEISAVPMGALDTALAVRSADEDLETIRTLLRERPELHSQVEALLLAAPQHQAVPEDSWAGWFNQE
jgi:hypothetical protein